MAELVSVYNLLYKEKKKQPNIYMREKLGQNTANRPANSKTVGFFFGTVSLFH